MSRQAMSGQLSAASARADSTAIHRAPTDHVLPSSPTAGQSVVQVETLGEFGVFLIMFVVGLEFSPDKLQRVGTHGRYP